MKKILKLSALAFGAIGLVTGMSSCKKDEDSNECCKATYTYSGITMKMEACEDGSYSVEAGSYSYSGNWKEDGEYTWSEIKEEFVEDYGATCS